MKRQFTEEKIQMSAKFTYERLFSHKKIIREIKDNRQIQPLAYQISKNNRKIDSTRYYKGVVREEYKSYDLSGSCFGNALPEP